MAKPIISSNYYTYSARGPLDSKALVNTFDELLLESTWQVDGANNTKVIVAYNGMVTAVRLNKADTSKNGIYFLHDPSLKSTLGTPDVTKAENWHKLAEVSAISTFEAKLSETEAAFNTALQNINAKLAELEADDDVITYGYRSGFPSEGEANKLYIAADEKKSYVWFNDAYLPVGGDSDKPDVIYGGDSRLA